MLGQQVPGASKRGSEGTHFAMEEGAGHWRRRASEVRAKQKRTKAPSNPPALANDPAHRPAPVRRPLQRQQSCPN